MMLTTLTLMMVLGAQADPDTARREIVSEEVTFVAGGRTIPGTLVKPVTGRGPALLLLAGSGPTDRDWNSPLLSGKNGSGRLLAEALAARGVTVLRFDKSFSGRNSGPPIADLSLDTFRDEAMAALDLLRSRSEVDPDRIVVAGHSEGGIHAIRLAAERTNQLRGAVLIAAPGRSMRDLLEVQLEQNVLSAFKLSPADLAAEMGQVKTALRRFAAGQDVDPATASTRPQVVMILGALMAPQVARIGRELVSFEPAGAVAALDLPVLVLQGGKDIQVDPVEDAERLVAARRSVGKAVEYRLVPLADHVLKTETRSLEAIRAIPGLEFVAGYNAPDRTLDPEVVEGILRWLRAPGQGSDLR